MKTVSEELKLRAEAERDDWHGQIMVRTVNVSMYEFVGMMALATISKQQGVQNATARAQG